MQFIPSYSLVVQVHERLVAMGPYKPVAGNKAGSYLTAFSLQGFYSNINGIIIGLVQIFADQSYWQSAVAASPIHAVKVLLCLLCLSALLMLSHALLAQPSCHGAALPAVLISQIHAVRSLLCVLCLLRLQASAKLLRACRQTRLLS